MFKENSKAIYLQIADKICDDILGGELAEGGRLPSVREYAASIQVNPNTMMRTYDYLSAKEIIYNKRGIGFFISPGARSTVIKVKSDELLSKEIYEVFRQLQLLGITSDTLKNKYEEYLNR